jgi:hypothetical protein
LSTNYGEFLAHKAIVAAPCGLHDIPALNPRLFSFQADIVRWALTRGRAAVFADCGMGKTAMQLEWAKHVAGEVLILAPLAVAAQTVREGEKFAIPCSYARSPEQIRERITVTNYEMLDKFAPDQFGAVVIDESSILKSYDGATRTAIIEAFDQTPYRLACTATPAPNDYMELGNHAEFLGVMTRQEMLSTFFVHDGGETQKWRLKGHAEGDFWRWLCSWAVMIRAPSDVGYENGDFILPELILHEVCVKVDEPTRGFLFPVQASTLQERIGARRDMIKERVAHCAAIANETAEPFLVWCNLNAESEMLVKAIHGAVEVKGSDSLESKERALLDFSEGRTRCLVTKPSIAGHGLNWQYCAKMAFVGLSDSWEQYYQAVRRCWRFGQTKPVNVYLISAETEGAVLANIKRKERDATIMTDKMLEHMKDLNEAALHGATSRFQTEYERRKVKTESWEMVLGDCVEVIKGLGDQSIDFSIYSPPFASLYTYSASDRDMGNSRNHAEFYEHYRYLACELLRVLKPGRLISFHCMNLPSVKVRDGVIGLRDFRGELIRLHEAEGWIYHSEVCIWKDPVTAMQRTKALGLLHKQLKKDSCMSRQGIPDYLVTMRKPGENLSRVSHTNESYPVSEWQRIASPIWTDINPSDTLQRQSAREERDERHIAPLQLEVIRRALRLWSNPNDLVLSPFAGIGSEGFVSIQMNRRFLGIELKPSYFEQACANLAAATREQHTIFAA